MALVKFSELVEGVRGTIGGLTFSAGKAGAYCKQWNMPNRKSTPLQTATRADFGLIRQAYANLSDAQVLAWQALADDPPELDYDPFGVQRYLTGSAWHTRINMRRLQAGQAIDNDAPTSTPVVAPATFALTLYGTDYPSSDSYFEYTEDDFDGFYAFLELSPTPSSVRQSQTAAYRSIWCGAVTGATQTIITDELKAAFGYLAVGATVFGRLYKQSTDGIRSTHLAATTTVAIGT